MQSDTPRQLEIETLAPACAAELLQLLALLDAPVGRERVLHFARLLRLQGPDRNPHTAATLGATLSSLERAGQVGRAVHGFVIAPSSRAPALRRAVTGTALRTWAPTLAGLLSDRADFSYGYLGAADLPELVLRARVALWGGFERKPLQNLLAGIPPSHSPIIYTRAFLNPFDPVTFAQIPAPQRDEVAERCLAIATHRPTAQSRALLEFCLPRALGAPPPLRLRCCEHLIVQGRPDEAERLLAGASGGFVQALHGALAAVRGDYGKATGLFEESVRDLRNQGPGHVALPLAVAWLRLAALIAGGNPAQLGAARKLARAEERAAARTSEAPLWKMLGEVCEVRLGDREVSSVGYPWLPDDDAFAFLIAAVAAAWVDLPPQKAQGKGFEAAAAALESGGFAWAAWQLRSALAPKGGARERPVDVAPSCASLVAAIAVQSPWQRALLAMQALAVATGPATSASRLLWVIVERETGGYGLEPREQKNGPRGWSRPKAVTLSRLAKSDALDPVDAVVCRAITRVGGATFELDRARAFTALIGHPRVYMANDPETPVEVVRGAVELRVQAHAQGLRLQLPRGLREAVLPRDDASVVGSGSGAADPVALWPESPSRVQVITLTAAHRRMIELLGTELEVPPEGVPSMQQAVASVAHLFDVHTDTGDHADDEPAQMLLRAELSPLGTGLRLRLAVRPFGDQGPRHAPGAGGSRVLAKIDGVSRAARRDLAQERAVVDKLLGAATILEPGVADGEWQVDTPEASLLLVEQLQSLGELVRVEWPAGKPLTLTRAYRSGDLRVQIRDGRDWFVAAGGLKLDDGSVVELRRLVEFARQQSGRYLPLGDAGFLTLSEDLRRRIDDLARLADRRGDDLRLPRIAAEAVADILADAQLEGDASWRDALARLRDAQSVVVDPPSTLQAELRPYQQEGFRWLARHAHAGTGACLADDMGLGKTVQTLALLVHRAQGGAALVIAPTSVCGNWADEARRFAPTLRVLRLGAVAVTAAATGDIATLGPDQRGATIADAGAYDLVICSYALLQQDIERFAARRWHSLVLDEAQAVKNASTKRARAVLDLEADFRLACTGTPVENRLDELWMLLQFLNPGLLGSREQFTERFATPIERRQDAAAGAQLRRLVRPFVLRRTKTEVLTDLPPRTEITLTIEPDATERAFTEALRQSAVDAIAAADVPAEQRRFRVLAELMRLRRACCDPRLVAPQLDRPGAKLAAFAELAQELAANRHKALVFSQFVDFLALLREQLDSLGLSAQYLDGSTPSAERERRIAAFQRGEGDFFLISLKAGGFGLNLTAADYVIIADPWWNPAVEDQAASRAHRIGQQRPVTVYRLVMADSIESRILGLHHEKRALAETLFTGEGAGSPLSADELLELITGA